jgi:hypothetical protein
LTGGKQTQKTVAPQWIELTKDVVQEQKGVHTPRLLHQFVAAQAKCQRQRPLLALRGLSPSVALIEGEQNIVSLRANRGVTTKPVIIQGALERVEQVTAPGLFVLNAHSQIIVSQLLVVPRHQWHKIIEDSSTNSHEFFAHVAKISRPHIEFFALRRCWQFAVQPAKQCVSLAQHAREAFDDVART